MENTFKTFFVRQYPDTAVKVPESVSTIEMTTNRTMFAQGVIEATTTFIINRLYNPLVILLTFALLNPIKSIVSWSEETKDAYFAFLGRAITRVMNSAKPLSGSTRISDMQTFAHGNIEAAKLATMLCIPMDTFVRIQVNDEYYCKILGHLKEYLTRSGLEKNEVMNYWVHGVALVVSILPGVEIDEAAKIIGSLDREFETVITQAQQPIVGATEEHDVGGTFKGQEVKELVGAGT